MFAIVKESESLFPDVQHAGGGLKTVSVLSRDDWDSHFCTCEEEDSGLSDGEQERKGQKKSPKLKMNFYLFKMLRFIKNILCSIILNHTKTL